MAGLSGLNLVYESAGMHASLLGFCLESLIIDNDMLGHCQRCVRGIEVTDAALSIDTIAEVCLNGPGHYLGNEQTLRLMQTEYFYPAIGDRFSPKEWNEKGKPDILSRAIAEKKRILAERFPRHVPKAIDDRLRARFGELDQAAAQRHGDVGRPRLNPSPLWQWPPPPFLRAHAIVDGSRNARCVATSIVGRHRRHWLTARHRHSQKHNRNAAYAHGGRPDVVAAEHASRADLVQRRTGFHAVPSSVGPSQAI